MLPPPWSWSQSKITKSGVEFGLSQKSHACKESSSARRKNRMSPLKSCRFCMLLRCCADLDPVAGSAGLSDSDGRAAWASTPSSSLSDSLLELPPAVGASPGLQLPSDPRFCLRCLSQACQIITCHLNPRLRQDAGIIPAFRPLVCFESFSDSLAPAFSCRELVLTPI